MIAAPTTTEATRAAGIRMRDAGRAFAAKRASLVLTGRVEANLLARFASTPGGGATPKREVRRGGGGSGMTELLAEGLFCGPTGCTGAAAVLSGSTSSKRSRKPERFAAA